jgi:hypothetical protein
MIIMCGKSLTSKEVSYMKENTNSRSLTPLAETASGFGMTIVGGVSYINGSERI